MAETGVSLYIHIPFCSSFCDYCDFYSVIADKDSGILMDKYIKAVIEDIKFQCEYFNVKEIVTAYIGGGTPSALGAKRISILFEALKSILIFKPVEFTIEANPESAGEDFLTACLEGGVNRISLGAQSFCDMSRIEVNRTGDAKMLEKRLTLVSDFFPGAFSVDLITGLPYSDEKIVLEDIKRLLVYKPAHISLYSLSVESETPLEQKIKSKKVIMPSDEEADTQWLAGQCALKEAGYEHYEVSSFALPGKQCLHNVHYWLMDSWLGAGCAASGTIINEKAGNARRFTITPNVRDYTFTVNSRGMSQKEFLNLTGNEELDKISLMKESLLMGFRYCHGPDREKFKRRFGINVEDCITNTMDRWNKRNTQDIMMFLNGFLKEAFLEIDGREKNQADSHF